MMLLMSVPGGPWQREGYPRMMVLLSVPGGLWQREGYPGMMCLMSVPGGTLALLRDNPGVKKGGGGGHGAGEGLQVGCTMAYRPRGCLRSSPTADLSRKKSTLCFGIVLISRCERSPLVWVPWEQAQLTPLTLQPPVSLLCFASIAFQVPSETHT